MSSGATKKRQRSQDGKEEFVRLISKEIEDGRMSVEMGSAILDNHNELSLKIRRLRRRLKEVESKLQTHGATLSPGGLGEKVAAPDELVEALDMRQTRMSHALRQCMRKLGVVPGD